MNDEQMIWESYQQTLSESYGIKFNAGLIGSNRYVVYLRSTDFDTAQEIQIKVEKLKSNGLKLDPKEGSSNPQTLGRLYLDNGVYKFGKYLTGPTSTVSSEDTAELVKLALTEIKHNKKFGIDSKRERANPTLDRVRQIDVPHPNDRLL